MVLYTYLKKYAPCRPNHCVRTECSLINIRTERTEGEGGRMPAYSFLNVDIFKCCHLAAMIERLQRYITECCATAVIYRNETRSHLGNSFTLERLLPPLV